MTELSQRYDFLLHPIKDLTKNWNVDIATVLEDFSEEIEKMAFSFDGGKTKLNFAEAAMLIQGTACVWSRKVESLYNLVYQTLEMVMSSRHSKQPTSINNQGIDNDVTFDQHEDKFLNLDDIRLTDLRKKASGGADVICIAQRCPFLQHSENDRGSPFLNKSGEVTNYYHDFWSNNIVPQKRGIALLEYRIEDDIVQTENDASDDPQQDHETDENQSMDAPADDFLEDMDDGDVGDACPIEAFHQEEIAQVEEQRHNLRSRNIPEPTLQQTLVASPANVPLDPHCECTEWIQKPFRKGKTTNIPPSLLENPKKRKTSQPAPPLPLISDFLNNYKKLIQGDDTSIAREKSRRQERWKQLEPHRIPERRGTNNIDQEHIPNDIDDFGDHVDADADDDDVCDVDDLIDDVTLGAASIEGEEQNLSDPDIATYEDLVRHHVEMFYSSAKRYVQESALSHRVKEWQESIEPFLAEQDDRPEFDIHKYGDHIVKQFQQVGDTNTFKTCVKGEEKSEICRYFSAVLQLANDEILNLSSESGDLQASINTLDLKLLTHNRPRDRITGYVPH